MLEKHVAFAMPSLPNATWPSASKRDRLTIWLQRSEESDRLGEEATDIDQDDDENALTIA